MVDRSWALESLGKLQLSSAECFEIQWQEVPHDSFVEVGTWGATLATALEGCPQGWRIGPNGWKGNDVMILELELQQTAPEHDCHISPRHESSERH